MSQRKCKACGRPANKFKKALVLANGPSNGERGAGMGLVCRTCAKGGVIVVPAARPIVQRTSDEGERFDKYMRELRGLLRGTKAMPLGEMRTLHIEALENALHLAERIRQEGT